jgi:hypothetical protein
LLTRTNWPFVSFQISLPFETYGSPAGPIVSGRAGLADVDSIKPCLELAGELYRRSERSEMSVPDAAVRRHRDPERESRIGDEARHLPAWGGQAPAPSQVSGAVHTVSLGSPHGAPLASKQVSDASLHVWAHWPPPAQGSPELTQVPLPLQDSAPSQNRPSPVQALPLGDGVQVDGVGERIAAWLQASGDRRVVRARGHD